MTQQREVFYVELCAGEALDVEVPARLLDSEKIHITLESKSGKKARLRIMATKTVTIGQRFGSKRLTPA